jgi:hypothetical protein
LQYPKEEKPNPSKPSLLSSSDQAGPDDVRILTSLPPGKLQGKPAVTPMRKKARRRAGLLVGLLILIAGGIAGSLMLGRSGPAPVSAAASAPPVVAAAAPPAPPAPPVQPAQTQTPPLALADTKSSEPAEHSDAAIITDENPPKPGSADALRQDKLTSALEAGVKPPPAALQTALEASPAPVAQKPAVHAKLVNRADKAKPEEHKKASKPAVVAKDKNKDKGVNKDGDVDLISALVAHTADPAQKSNAKPKSPKLEQADKDASKSGPHQRNEDIVERRGGESTESLLQRCRTLGFIEGELCRWRICSGRWDSDASCKANVK